MKRWMRLATAKTPDGQELSLWERDTERVIRVGTAELMSTRQHSSEERMADLACAKAGSIEGARVLVGGFGFGYTLGRTLKLLKPTAVVTVAEIMPAVIAWHRDPNLKLPNSRLLEDARVQVVERDVVDVLGKNSSGFDAIMLDVDNGPDAMTTSGNNRLYEESGLYLVRGALRKGGIVVFWSAAPDVAFEKKLGRAGFKVEVETARAHSGSRQGLGGGSRHTLFIGRT